MKTGLQARIRVFIHLFVRFQYLRSVRDYCNNLFIPALRRWLRLRSLVLAHIRCGMYVHCRVRGGIGLRIPYQRWPVLHRLASCAAAMGAVGQLVDGLD